MSNTNDASHIQLMAQLQDLHVGARTLDFFSRLCVSRDEFLSMTSDELIRDVPGIPLIVVRRLMRLQERLRNSAEPISVDLNPSPQWISASRLGTTALMLHDLEQNNIDAAIERVCRDDNQNLNLNPSSNPNANANANSNSNSNSSPHLRLCSELLAYLIYLARGTTNGTESYRRAVEQIDFVNLRRAWSALSPSVIDAALEAMAQSEQCLPPQSASWIRVLQFALLFYTNRSTEQTTLLLRRLRMQHAEYQQEHVNLRQTTQAQSDTTPTQLTPSTPEKPKGFVIPNAIQTPTQGTNASIAQDESNVAQEPIVPDFSLRLLAATRATLIAMHALQRLTNSQADVKYEDNMTETSALEIDREIMSPASQNKSGSTSTNASANTGVHATPLHFLDVEQLFEFARSVMPHGHAEASLQLGLFHLEGRLAHSTNTRSIEHLRDASRLGLVEGHWRLAEYYSDLRKSREWERLFAYHMREAIDGGHGHAISVLADIFTQRHRGSIATQLARNLSTFLTNLEALHDSQSTRPHHAIHATLALGRIRCFGPIDCVDEPRGRQLLQSLMASHNSGENSRSRNTNPPQKASNSTSAPNSAPTPSTELYTPYISASREQTRLEAGVYLGHLFCTSRNTSEQMRGLEMLRHAAERGNSLAAYHLSQIFQFGNDVQEADEQLHRTWLQRACEGHYAEALYDRGMNDILFLGPQATNWSAIAAVSEAAEQGHEAAQEYCLTFFENFRPPREICARAERWISKLADRDNRRACYLLGHFAEVGKCGSRNKRTAIRYYTRAEKLGNTKASESLRRISNTDLRTATNFADAQPDSLSSVSTVQASQQSLSSSNTSATPFRHAANTRIMPTSEAVGTEGIDDEDDDYDDYETNVGIDKSPSDTDKKGGGGKYDAARKRKR